MAKWIRQPFLAATMFPTAAPPAPVLRGDSLPEPQMWASDHSGSIRVHLFQIHNEDKDPRLGLKYMLEMWEARKRTESPWSKEWQIQKNLPKQYAPETGRHWVQIPFPKVPSALKLHFLLSFAQEHYRGTHQSISSLAKAIIIRQDRDSWGHRKKSANKPGWSTGRGGTTGMETRKLWESHELSFCSPSAKAAQSSLSELAADRRAVFTMF